MSPLTAFFGIVSACLTVATSGAVPAYAAASRHAAECVEGNGHCVAGQAAGAEGRDLPAGRGLARMESILLQTRQQHGRDASEMASVDPGDRCEVEEWVQCPSSHVWCEGSMCCPGIDGGENFPCPSAPPGWGRGACQSVEKVWDCTHGEAPETPAPAVTTSPTAVPTVPTTIPTTAATPAPTPVPQPEPTSSGDVSGMASTDAGGDVRLMSFNVWYGNSHMNDVAELIQNQVDPDVVNLQEAVNWQPAAVVEELNALGEGEWKLANEFGADHFWCGLNAYRSDRWDMEWSKNVGYQGSRGICGARLRRKSDGMKLCVWGTHPIWFQGDVRSAKEGVRAGAAAMKECAKGGVKSAMMCDCNTFDANGVAAELRASTGWEWQIAHADSYDQIYVQSGSHGSDLNAASATTTTGGTIEPGAGPRGCQANCQNPKWAGADHPPVYADVHFG